jgi:hypothetical protein
LFCIVPNIALSLTCQMKKMPANNTIKTAALALAYLLCSLLTQAQNKNGKSLADEILKQDSVLFSAFNTRNMETFGSMFSADLEFFHDKGGLTDYTYTMNSLKNLSNSNSDLKRELIKETLEVYPVPGYGAIQTGQHIFTHTENGQTEKGIFKFVHIWKLTDGKWKITRVVSYNH